MESSTFELPNGSLLISEQAFRAQIVETKSVLSSLRTRAANPMSRQYAGVHQRAGAALIDAIVSFALVLVFTFAIARPVLLAILSPAGRDPQMLWAEAGAGQKTLILLLFFASVWLPSAFYYAVLESSSRQATLGKMAFGLRTTRTDGNRVSFVRANARYLLKALIGAVVPLGFIALLPIFGERRQGMHDWLMGIVVARRATQ
jgi:uncharacterized RDD family membrane protein YckC